MAEDQHRRAVERREDHQARQDGVQPVLGFPDSAPGGAVGPQRLSDVLINDVDLRGFHCLLLLRVIAHAIFTTLPGFGRIKYLRSAWRVLPLTNHERPNAKMASASS